MPTKKQTTKYSWQLLNLFHQYKDETGVEAVNLDEVYEWAAAKGLYVEPPSSASARFKRDMSRALRSQHHQDPQNREVRTNLPVVVSHGPRPVVLWADQRTARPKHVQLFLQQARLSIAANCKRHKTIRDSYTDNNLFGAQLQLFDYNFNDDVAEADQPTKYPTERPKS